MATTYAVDIEFKAKGSQALQQFTRQAESLQRTVEGVKLDALSNVVGALPGRLGAATNGIISFNRGLKDAQTQARATAAEIALLQKAIDAKKIQLNYKGGIGGEGLKKEIASMEGALAGMKGGGSAAAIGLGAVATAGVAAAAGIVAVTASAVTFNNEIERNRQQLTLFTKDLKVTNQIIASLQRTADSTSLGLPGLLEATKTLSAYGIEAQNAGAAVKMLGDLALGDNEKLQRFSVNFAQIASLGKAYTVDLKQFGMAGIPIFDALSKVTGKSTAEIMKMAEEGRIAYPLVVKALQDLTKEGASFYKGAERGGTTMDRAIQQMLGSWEKLQQKIGTAVTPAIVAGINKIAETLDGLLAIIDKVGSSVDKLHNGPLGQVFDFVLSRLKDIISFVDQNPALAFLIPGFGQGLALNSAIRGQANNAAKKGNPAADEKERAKLAADAQKKAEADAKAQIAKLNEENAKKIADVNLTTERALAEARLGYEEQVADYRRQQLERIADLERQIRDEWIKQDFANEQAASRAASLTRQISGDLAIGAAAGGGQDVAAMQAAQDTAKILEDAARSRREIEFNATQRRVEIERRLTDFKRETQRQLGEMQLAYTRETDSILRKAGQNIQDLMVKGAQQAKEILESVQMNPGGGGGSSGGSNTKIGDIAAGALAPETRALLKTIRFAEGTAGPNGYNTMFTGRQFSDLSRHPRQLQRGGGYASDAAGAYQFLSTTWDGIGGGAFTPERQDRGAVALIKRRGVDPLLPNGFTPQVADRLAPEWASFPTLKTGTSYYGQGGKSYAQLKSYYEKQLAAERSRSGVSAPANNIVPTGSIPTTSPGLEKANQQLTNAVEEDRKLQILQKEKEITAELAGSYKALTVEQQASLKAAQEKNRIEEVALGLIRDGVKPELAQQLATNQQLVEGKTKELEVLRQQATALAEEKGITAETRAERQRILDAINAQIAAQPGLLGQLDAEAQRTQALADQRAAMDQAKSDAQGISSTITGGFKEALKAAVTGGDVKAALSNMLGSLGDRLLDIALRPLEDMLTNALTGLFNPQTLATNANTAATYQNTAALTAMGSSLAGMAGVGAGGDIFGGIAGIAGAIFGVAGAGFGGGAFGSGFNPLSTGKMFPGGIFASGGSTPVNTPVLVGERGPELFVPGQSGGITNHQNLRSMMNSDRSTSQEGGSGVNLNMSFQTTQFMDREWVDREQLDAAMARAAKTGAERGHQRTLDKLRQSPSTRRRVGI